MTARLVRFLELVRFSHTLFALPFAMLAAVMAWAANARCDPPISWRWQELAGILVCMACARSAAMALNRLVDRRFDALNPRTQSRHLPQGTLGVTGVVGFTVVMSLGFIAGTLLFLPRNPWPLFASVPVLLFLFAYSFTKRFTAFSHLWLGAALMLAPVAAWVAVRAQLDWAPIVLGLAVMLWVTGFDVIYACQDATFDTQMRLYSIPARWGVSRALQIAAMCHFGMVLTLCILPMVYDFFGAIYYVGVACIGGLLVYEHRLVDPNDPRRVNQAFFNVNAVISVGLFVIGSLDLFF